VLDDADRQFKAPGYRVEEAKKAGSRRDAARGGCSGRQSCTGGRCRSAAREAGETARRRLLPRHVPSRTASPSTRARSRCCRSDRSRHPAGCGGSSRSRHAGLSGHLDEIWPDVGGNSGWLGGTGESWERGPYYLDGLLPLAYLLHDDALIAKAQRYVEWTLTHQAANGWIGPASNTDWWPNMVMLKVLTQYQEATGDPRVVPALTKYFVLHLQEAGRRPLHQWAVYRWADELLSVIWLYNRTADPRLLTLARTLHNQGEDWASHYAHFEFENKTSTRDLALGPADTEFSDRAMRAHGVNNAMALKTSAVWSLVSRDAVDRDAVLQALDVLDKFHGSRTACSAPTSTTPGAIRPKAPSSAPSSRRCSRSSRCWPCAAACRWPTGSSASPTTRFRRRSRPTCGRISTTSRPTRCCAACARAAG
jgi:hypothetical protein